MTAAPINPGLRLPGRWQWPSPWRRERCGGPAEHAVRCGLALWLALVALACLPALPVAPASAQTVDPTPLQFRDAAEEARFHRLASELRCVMCQNQSLADSNAQIAHDLRREVLNLMRGGRSDAEVKRFLVDRYGEFVLYRPEVGARTWLLWFGPALLLLAGGLLVHRIVRNRAARTPPPGAAGEEQEW